MVLLLGGVRWDAAASAAGNAALNPGNNTRGTGTGSGTENKLLIHYKGDGTQYLNIN